MKERYGIQMICAFCKLDKNLAVLATIFHKLCMYTCDDKDAEHNSVLHPCTQHSPFPGKSIHLESTLTF